MGAITPAGSSASNIAVLLSGETSPAPPASDLPASNASDPAAGNDRGPATSLTLSDQVKSILAKAVADQDVADRLKAFVESRRTDGGASSAPANDGSTTDAGKTDVNKAFAQLTASTQTTAGATDLAPVEAAHDFSNGVTFQGFTVSVAARASDGSFKTELIGPNGLSFFDFRFGHAGEASGFSGLKPGVSASSYQSDNVEYISFTENEAAATGATASSRAGTVSTSTVAAHSSQITFAIDFTTGAIQATSSDSLIASTSAQVGPPSASVSRLA
jgi:hypothetical protein